MQREVPGSYSGAIHSLLGYRAEGLAVARLSMRYLAHGVARSIIGCFSRSERAATRGGRL